MCHMTMWQDFIMLNNMTIGGLKALHVQPFMLSIVLENVTLLLVN